MNESRLQHECVVWFGQTYPEKRGQLFAVNNEANGNKQAMYFKSMGVIPGIPDLLFIRDSGKLVGIEMKLPGSKHKIDHVQNQVDWGMKIIGLGCESYFCKSMNEFMRIIQGPAKGMSVLTALDVNQMIIQSKKKTIIF